MLQRLQPRVAEWPSPSRTRHCPETAARPRTPTRLLAPVPPARGGVGRVGVHACSARAVRKQCARSEHAALTQRACCVRACERTLEPLRKIDTLRRGACVVDELRYTLHWRLSLRVSLSQRAPLPPHLSLCAGAVAGGEVGASGWATAWGAARHVAGRREACGCVASATWLAWAWRRRGSCRCRS